MTTPTGEQPDRLREALERSRSWREPEPPLPGYHSELQDVLVRWAWLRRMGAELGREATSARDAYDARLAHLLDRLSEAYDEATDPAAPRCRSCHVRPATTSVEPGWSPTHCRQCLQGHRP